VVEAAGNVVLVLYVLAQEQAVMVVLMVAKCWEMASVWKERKSTLTCSNYNAQPLIFQKMITEIR
jgi:hypothetical protein